MTIKSRTRVCRHFPLPYPVGRWHLLTLFPHWTPLRCPATLGPYRRPLWPLHAGPKRLGAGYGFYLEVHRSHLASLDDPRARWPLP